MAQRLTYSSTQDASNEPFKYVPLAKGLTHAVDSLNNDMNISPLLAFLDECASRKGQVERDLDIPASITDCVVLPESPEQADHAEAKWLGENSSMSTRSLAALNLVDNILGVIFRPLPKSQDTGIALYQPGVTPSEEIESLLTQRRDAKQSKDFAAADAIRDQLASMGLSIMDKPGGKVEVAPTN